MKRNEDRISTHQAAPASRVAACLRRGGQSSDEWYTPPEFIAALGEFDLDPACGPLCTNHTAVRRYGPQEDGLAQVWAGRVWLNPPFSNASPFIDRLAEHGDGIALVFTRSDAVWYQRAVERAGGVFLLKGRIHFQRPGGGPSRCPLGCSLLPFGERNRRAVLRSGLPGLFLSPHAPADHSTD